jgi:hypothetical protein
MLGWLQCGFLWALVAVTFAVPVVRSVAYRLTLSVLGAFFVVIFLLLNSYNHAPSVRGATTEYYGYPYTYYDNRDHAFRPARNGSDFIPGDRWVSSSNVCPPSLLGNLAVYFLVTTILAWPISALELFMARGRKRKSLPDEESHRHHERPSWAR